MVLDELLYQSPNRNVPVEQVSSRAQGWANGVDDAWFIQFQVCLPEAAQFNILLTQDADVDFDPPDRKRVFLLSADGFMNFV